MEIQEQWTDYYDDYKIDEDQYRVYDADEADKEIKRLREIFQVTRRSMCEAFGVEKGKSYSSLEDIARQLVKEIERLKNSEKIELRFKRIGMIK